VLHTLSPPRQTALLPVKHFANSSSAGLQSKTIISNNSSQAVKIMITTKKTPPNHLRQPSSLLSTVFLSIMSIIIEPSQDGPKMMCYPCSHLHGLVLSSMLFFGLVGGGPLWLFTCSTQSQVISLRLNSMSWFVGWGQVTWVTFQLVNSPELISYRGRLSGKRTSWLRSM